MIQKSPYEVSMLHTVIFSTCIIHQRNGDNAADIFVTIADTNNQLFYR